MADLGIFTTAGKTGTLTHRYVEEAAKNEAATYSLNAANSALDDVENNIVATTPFTHLELSNEEWAVYNCLSFF